MILPVLLSLLLAALPQTHPAAPHGNTIHSDALHYTVTYPAGFAPNNEGPAAIAQARKQPDANAQQCVTSPLIVTRKDAANDVELLLMVDLDLDCLKAPSASSVLAPIATNSLKQGLRRLGEPMLEPPFAYTIDGHDAITITGTAQEPKGDKKGYAQIVCTLDQHHDLCFSALSTTREHLHEMLASTISFDGHPAKPLVPPAHK